MDPSFIPAFLLGAPFLSPTNIFAPVSTPAQSILDLSLFVLEVTAAVFLVVFSLLAYAVVKFRKRKTAEGREPAQVYGSSQLELAWTVIPVLIVVILFLAAARVIASIQNAPKPDSAIEVTVIGHQFWWEFRYPSLEVVTANELHIPVSDPAHPTPTFLTLLSADTDHSFWVPRLAGKTDLIPNHPNSMWVDPHETGLFLGQCAQYCGTQHALMLLRVYVQTRDEFDRWIREQSLPAQASGADLGGTEDLRADGLHQLPHRRRYRRKWPLRPGPDSPDEPRHDCFRRGDEHTGKSAALDSGSQHLQTGMQNAGHGIERSGTRRRDPISGDPSLMSTQSISLPGTVKAQRPLVEQLHQWVTTVDHKRLGLLYIFLCAGVSCSRGS